MVRYVPDLKHRRLRELGLLVALVTFLSVIPVAQALAFSDVPTGHRFAQAIHDLSVRKIIEGFPDGTFKPAALVVRQQFAKMVVLTLDIPVTEKNVCTFSDVMKTGPSTLYPDNYVAVAATTGITKGVGNNRFDPWANISGPR